MEFTKTISTQEARKHNTPEDCWIVIDDQVWDVTGFAPEHPGGANRTFQVQPRTTLPLTFNPVILKDAGRDATTGYSEYHSPSLAKDTLPLDCFKGNLDRSTIDAAWKPDVVKSNVTQAAPEGEKTPLDSIINAYAPASPLEAHRV